MPFDSHFFYVCWVTHPTNDEVDFPSVLNSASEGIRHFLGSLHFWWDPELNPRLSVHEAYEQSHQCRQCEKVIPRQTLVMILPLIYGGFHLYSRKHAQNLNKTLGTQYTCEKVIPTPSHLDMQIHKDQYICMIIHPHYSPQSCHVTPFETLSQTSLKPKAFTWT